MKHKVIDIHYNNFDELCTQLDTLYEDSGIVTMQVLSSAKPAFIKGVKHINSKAFTAKVLICQPTKKNPDAVL